MNNDLYVDTFSDTQTPKDDTINIPCSPCGFPEQCDLVKYFKTLKTQIVVKRCENCPEISPTSYKIKPVLKYITLQDNFDQWRNKFNAVISKVRNVEEFPPFPTKVDGVETESIDNFVLSTSYLVDIEDNVSKQVIIWKSMGEYLKEYSVQFTPKADEIVQYKNKIEVLDDYDNVTIQINKDGSADFTGKITILGKNEDPDDSSTELISLETKGAIYSDGNVYANNFIARGNQSYLNFIYEGNTVSSYIKESKKGVIDINENLFSNQFSSLKSDLYLNNDKIDFIIRNSSPSNGIDDTYAELLFNSIHNTIDNTKEFEIVPLTIHTNAIEIGKQNIKKNNVSAQQQRFEGIDKTINASEYDYRTDLGVYGNTFIAGTLDVNENAFFQGNTNKFVNNTFVIKGKTDSIPANLDIRANGSITGENLAINSITSITKNLNVVGDINCSGKLFQSIWNDICEFFERGELTEAGDIIALDENSERECYIKAIASSKCVVGVHSDSYGQCLGGDNVSEEENIQNYIPVALCGRVYVKVYGNIERGDFIVPSNKRGIGKKKESNDEQVIGIALETNHKTGIHKVRIKVISH